ncbi:cation-translocating P-type ATPase [Mycobacterium parmense]|uniref:Haloacid dehalogenase n=1 Tax=Mycobacterium parmense TaxID=185642 RepID=A0A7I7YXN5_9MYCO|nr:cation-translocating P-type ATPase [Mycobacterium parmense]MCV7350508.1 cation-translocating P-type ATPase [Mycobacterium parmense]ORW48234.1 haloacid dehalogenase [Mycobacterium parmense]BBZ46067.1 haloacid dehalogenase [Mycobacterium parmense]
MNIATSIRRSAPLRAVETGLNIAVIPVREGARALTGNYAYQRTPRRRCWRGDDRAWIEVRGLDREHGRDLGRSVLDAVRAHPGVASAGLNYALSRVVVTVEGPGTSLRELCDIVDSAEKSCGATKLKPAERPASLPGDGLVLAARAATVAVDAAGLTVALTGRALRLPRAPIAVLAGVVAVDYQPWLRGVLESRIGRPATDTAMAFALAAAETVTQSPASLSVGLLIQSLKAAESRAAARAWRTHEPELARRADQPQADALPPRLPRGRPREHHAGRFALFSALSAGVVGATTRNLNTAATALLVTTPAANRTTVEAFAAKLGQGLADRHGVLSLRPDALRRLDRIDAIVIDPRVLCTDTVRVARIRGADDAELAAAWTRAQLALDGDGAAPGWHRVPAKAVGRPSAKIEALYRFAHHPLASAVVAEAHRAGSELVSVDAESLGELRPAFDDIRPLDGGSIDDALARTVTDLQGAGRTVVVLSSVAAQAIWSADVALGVMPRSGADAPPWNADLLLPDLAAAWRVLHALPAARAAAQRGVAISAGATAMGSLLMIPGVRGIGRGPVTTGAAAGALSGYLLAHGIIGADSPRPAAAQEWHAMSVEQARRALPSSDQPPDGDPGQLALAAIGAPTAGSAGHGFWQFVKAVRAELTDPLTPVLALGSAASAVLGSPVDAVLVFSVLAGNSMLAASQRLRAENRLNVLLAQQIPPARKVAIGPGGERSYTDAIAAQLQPGDLIEVRTHEVVPADARIVEEVDLEVDESTLTGESLSVEKQVDATPGADLAERRCMLYAGTTVVAGTALALVTAVGADTQERRAAELVSADTASDVGLQHQLSQLTNRAFPVSMTGGALVGALGLLRRTPLREAVASGIAIAVAAVPEGMPLVATLAQAASARRLTKFGALVRVPRSVEALGRIDVVCFDKTGTLSQNRLRVAEVRPAADHSREEVLRCAAHAAPPTNGNPHIHATDAAIVEAAASVNGAHSAAPVAHLPFRSGRSFSASATGDELTVKGAPEVVLAACGEARSAAEQTVADMAAGGLRVIAVAQRRLTPQQARAVRDNPDDIAGFCGSGLTLTGFLGLSDTPRPEALGLLADLRQQGVGVKLITGDHPITALAIATELGLPVTADQVISGVEWDALSRKDQERVVTERVIFARMTPENKVQVVQTLESAGVRTAMVGDGANDAAAIRAATVGIGVVAGGSDPAHMAADVVLVDARIEALIPAILEGRQLWQRVQAAVAVLLGGNTGEVLFAIVGSAITGTSPLNTRQLLLVNMMTDALPAAALAVSKPSGPVDPGIRGPDQPALWRAVAIRGVTTAGATTAAWLMASVTGRPQRASTVALIALVGAELGQTLLDSHAPLVVLTAAGSLAVMGTLISIPVVSQLLGCTPLGPVGWAQALGAAGAATVGIGVLNRVAEGLSSSDTRPQPAAAPSDGEAAERPQPRRATTAHRVQLTAREAPKRSTKPADRHSRSST